MATKPVKSAAKPSKSTKAKAAPVKASAKTPAKKGK
ncbi:hypothetical protein Pla123a_18410 [Posidoniimonas polymericola]|uniref:Uncharacterized protein n=1 Tax=Posidoniimonas polymericola TaxID=2528002 RepID=A0A5C5YTB0_9BACT|nr:hypothetical protein Pla123a_18410 [Posidoniimonas polymericola]